MSITVEIPDSLGPALEGRARAEKFATVEDYVLSLVRNDVAKILGPFDVHTPEHLAEALRVADEEIDRGEYVEWKPGDIAREAREFIDRYLREAPK